MYRTSAGSPMWNKPNEPPKDRTIALVIINGQIEASIWIYHANKGVFITQSMVADELVDYKLKLSEVEGWMRLADIPLPPGVTVRAA
jgi:hypothetical protein